MSEFQKVSIPARNAERLRILTKGKTVKIIKCDKCKRKMLVSEESTGGKCWVCCAGKWDEDPKYLAKLAELGYIEGKQNE